MECFRRYQIRTVGVSCGQTYRRSLVWYRTILTFYHENQTLNSPARKSPEARGMLIYRIMLNISQASKMSNPNIKKKIITIKVKTSRTRVFVW